MRQQTTLLSTLLILASALICVLNYPTDSGLQSSTLAAPAPVPASVPTPEPRATASRPELRKDGFFWAPVGSRFVFAGGMQTDSEVRQENAAASPVCFGVAARMTWLVCGRRPGELLCEVRFSELELRMQAARRRSDREDAIAAQLQAPVMVRMQSDGRLLGLGFAPELEIQARAFARSMICALQHQVRDEAEYELAEMDPTGEAVVRYAWDDGARRAAPRLLRKQLLRYASLGSGEAELAPQVAGAGEAEMRADLGFVGSFAARQTVEVPVQELKAVIHTSNRVRFTLVAHDVLAIDAAPRWDAEFAAVCGAADARAAGDRREQDRQARRLKDRSIQQLVQDLLARIAAGDLRSTEFFATSQDLMWKLRLDPDGLQLIDTLVVAADADAQTRHSLLAIAAASGTAQAEDYLNGLLGGEQAMAVQEAAARSMFQLRQPRRRSLETLAGLVRQRSTSARLSSTSLLVLGAHARDAADPETAGGIDALLALESVAAERGQVEDWLEALGNAHSPKAIEPARRYLDHEQVLLRIAAAHALLAVHHPEATTLLLERLGREALRPVRQALVEALAPRHDRRALAAIATVLREDPQVLVRRQAVLGLAGRQEAAVRDLLRRVAAEDADQDLRALAARILARPAQG